MCGDLDHDWSAGARWGQKFSKSKVLTGATSWRLRILHRRVCGFSRAAGITQKQKQHQNVRYHTRYGHESVCTSSQQEYVECRKAERNAHGPEGLRSRQTTNSNPRNRTQLPATTVDLCHPEVRISVAVVMMTTVDCLPRMSTRKI